MSILFSRKIKCLNCGKNYKAKRERQKISYVCGNYDNYGKCKREVIKQQFLIDLLQRRYGKDFEISKDNIQEIVESVEIKNKETFTINLQNDIPIIFGDNFIQY